MYEQKSDLFHALSEHVFPLQLLADEKDITLNFRKGFAHPQLINSYTCLTEFILLMSRIIHKSNPHSEITIAHGNHKREVQSVCISLICSDLPDLNLQDLNIGLDIQLNSTLFGRGFKIDLLFPNKLTPEKGGNQISDCESKSKFKPFHKNLRENLKSHYTTIKSLHQDAIDMSFEDGRFLERVNESINENLGNVQFGADYLQKHLGISRSQLYRKLKSLVRRSPAEYIRFVRLMKAKELLERTNFRIGDIAFDLGYTDQSHFTRAFKNQFGFHPSFYRKTLKSHENF